MGRALWFEPRCRMTLRGILNGQLLSPSEPDRQKLDMLFKMSDSHRRWY
jgi:hypothetical protein